MKKSRREAQLEAHIESLKACIRELNKEIEDSQAHVKYERTIGTFLRYFYQKGEFEYPLSTGKRLDIVTNDGKTLIEIKHIDRWEDAIGQLQRYKRQYCKDTYFDKEEIRTEIILFGEDPTEELREEINEVAADSNIDAVRFITNINLIEDRR